MAPLIWRPKGVCNLALAISTTSVCKRWVEELGSVSSVWDRDCSAGAAVGSAGPDSARCILNEFIGYLSSPNDQVISVWKAEMDFMTPRRNKQPQSSSRYLQHQESDKHPALTSTQGAVQAFVREQNMRLLERALKAEANPDDRRILRRLLREQERIHAAESSAETTAHHSRMRSAPRVGRLCSSAKTWE